MDNILKVCDDQYCIEVFNNVSNISRCSYNIYPSDNKHFVWIDTRWIIIILSIISFILVSLFIICIYYYYLRKKNQLNSKNNKNKENKANEDHENILNETATNMSTIPHSNTISKGSEYQPIPGNIGTDNFTYFRFNKELQKEAENEENNNKYPSTTHISNHTSEEELLIDKTFNTLRDRTSNSIHAVKNNKKLPYQITQIKHRGSTINIAVEKEESSEESKDSNSITTLHTNTDYSQCSVPIPNANANATQTPFEIDPNSEYQYFPEINIESRKSSFRQYNLKIYPAEYELNHLESMTGRDNNIFEGYNTPGTQDDMIYKTINDFDYKESDSEQITIDDFSRFSTIRLIKFFAPQEIKYSDIDFKNEEFIGQGSVGKVFKAKYNGIHVAVKKLNDKYFNLSKQDLTNFKREASLMQKVGGHKHIARMYGFCTSPEICIVTEYYSRKSMYDIIFTPQNDQQNDQRHLNNELKLNMCYQASLGILHLHQQNVIHRDISARNLLVDQNWTVVVSDLGMSQFKKHSTQKQKQNNLVGPIKWMAPESITMHIYNEKTDVYSFGITLYEIFSQFHPYPNLLPTDAGVLVVSKGLRPKINHLKFVKKIPMLGKLITLLWKHEPNERPKFKYISQQLKNIKL